MDEKITATDLKALLMALPNRKKETCKIRMKRLSKEAGQPIYFELAALDYDDVAWIKSMGGDMDADARLCLYAVSDGQRYEQPFRVDGWVVWQNPVITNISCTGGSMTIGVSVKANGGAWGTLDDFLLNPAD